MLEFAGSDPEMTPDDPLFNDLGKGTADRMLSVLVLYRCLIRNPQRNLLLINRC